MSHAQQTASRQNGAKSTGPSTEDGKARSSANAIKHGLTGGPVVLPHESQARYEELKRSLGKSYCATTPAEWNLIEEMAASRWRLTRIDKMETAILNEAYARMMAASDAGDVDCDRAMAMAFADVAENSKGFRILDRHQRTLWRSFEQCVKQLRSLQELRAEQNEPEHPADYSCLQHQNTYPRSPEFMEAALSHLAKQNNRMVGTGSQHIRRPHAA